MPLPIWDEDRLQVFYERLTQFAEKFHQVASVTVVGPTEVVLGNLLLDSGQQIQWLSEERSFLLGMAVGLGFSPERLQKLAIDCKLPPRILYYNKH